MSDESSAPVKATTPPPAWPSPWPYDFPVEDGSKTAKQVERLAPKDGRAPMKVTRRGIFRTAFVMPWCFAT